MNKRRTELRRPDSYTLRLDPKLRFAAELAAVVERRSLASFIEWAVHNATRQTKATNRDGAEISVARVADEVWDENELSCLLALGAHYPGLLTPEQRRLHKQIKGAKT